MRNDVINMSREKSQSPNVPLSYEGLVASWAIYKVHVCIVFLLKSVSMFLKESFQFCFNSTESLPFDECARDVYQICGRNFREALQKFPDGFRPGELCLVFIEEGNCNENEAKRKNCTESAVLNQFKDNSFKAARVVIPALCALPDKAKRGH